MKIIKIPDGGAKSQVCKVLTADVREKLRSGQNEIIDAWNAQYANTKNGVVFTGLQNNGKNLIIFDFDAVDNPDVEKFSYFVAKIIKCSGVSKEDLYIVQTGSGGYHFYFYVEYEEPIKGRKFKILNALVKQEFSVDGIDILGDGQFAFAEGSDFTEIKESGHFNPYKKLTPVDNPPTITKSSFDTMISAIEYASSPSCTLKKIGSLEILFRIQTKPIRAGFKRILNGDIQVTNDSFPHLQGMEGGAKFRVWAAFWAEIFAQDFTEEEIGKIIDALAETQTEFSRTETKANLRSMRRHETKPITQPTYKKYFEPWIEELKIEDREIKKQIRKKLGGRCDGDEEGEEFGWIVEISNDLMSGDFHVGYLVEHKEFFYFTGKIYQIDTNFVCSLVLDRLMEIGKKPNAHNQNQILNYIKAKNYKHVEDFDTQPELIVFQNGIYNTDTRVLIPHQPNYLAFKILPYNFIEGHEDLPELTFRFLESLEWPAEEVKRLLYITKMIVEQKLQKYKYFCVSWGVTNSGKTLWGEKIARMMGKQNQDWALMRLEKFGERFALQQLPGIRLAILDDVGVESLNSKAYSVLKTLTSGGSVEFEEKNVKARTETVRCAVYCSCNQLFRLPVQEEYKSLVQRAFIFHFKKEHVKDAKFATQFLENRTDNEELLSYLLNLPEADLHTLDQIPKFEKELYADAIQYWTRNANPIELICSRVLKKNTQNKAELDSMLLVLQQFANSFGLTIDMYSQWAINAVKSYCRRNLTAIVPRPVKNESNQMETWIYGVECPGARNDPISALDSIPNLANLIPNSQTQQTKDSGSQDQSKSEEKLDFEF